MKVRFFLVFVIIFSNADLLAQSDFEKDFRQFLAREEYRNASVGIHISETKTGKTVFGFNSEKLFIPASVLKVVTSAGALEILGPEYRFQTKLGYSGIIEKNTLKGNLIVVGGGDPALGSEYFRDHYFKPHFLETWAQQIRVAGIKRIEGDLVLDCSAYDSEKIPPTWIWEDMGNYYGAGSSALSVYDNQFRISFRSSAEAGVLTQIISVYPKIESLRFKNEVLSSDDQRDLAYVFGSPVDSNRVIRGSIPKNRKSFTIKASNPFPEQLLANDFLLHLARNGVFVSGKIVVDHTPDSAFQQIYITESPSLSEIVKVLNHESVNLFAEHLVKQIAFEKNGIGNRKNGLELISEYWKEKGLETSQLVMEDGSGLSHFNAVSPAFLTTLLNYMAQSQNCAIPFSESLPTAGNGTLHQFNSRLFPQNTLQAKSGSMTRVRCYAGYISPNAETNYSFAVLINHFSGTHRELIFNIEQLLLKFCVENQ